MENKKQKKTLEKIKDKYSADEQKLIEQAFLLAKKFHNGQHRKSGEGYITHPVSVAETLFDLNMDAETVAAGLLHDTIEDTKATIEEIRKNFGDNVAFLVEGVSKLKDVDYLGGEQTFVENFRKMILATAQDIRVVLIKLADVLHNLKTLEPLEEQRRQRYAREVLEVYAPISARLGIGWLKGELEDAAFPHVYPNQYKNLCKKVSRVIDENKKYVIKLKTEVESLLEEKDVDFKKIDARVKHLYSLWRKLKNQNDDLSKIYDLVALRIIVKDIPTCYEVLGIIHKCWTPLPGTIKDYIAVPKPNGYQSLHTTVFVRPVKNEKTGQTNKRKITEFQIRTEKMHEEAELGIAAHWAYKEQAHPFKKRLAWVQQLKDWQRAVGPNELLESLRIDFFQDRIFVFTPNGDVVDLPQRATPVDFAYAIHSDIGDRVVLAKVNGKPSQLGHPLSNNDIVEIVTAKNKKPSHDWLTFVKTSKARSKIRDHLKEGGLN